MDRKILIVEDQFLEAENLRSILTRAGFGVQGVAKSVDQAFASLNREVPDLVLVDILLTGDLNGIDLAGILYKRNIPFIYISANSNSNMLTEAMKTRPDGFLVKPFREQDLLMAMNIAVYRHQKNLEHVSRQKSWLTTLLDNVATMDGTRGEKIVALIGALTSFLPMDYVVIDTNADDVHDSTLYQYQRTAFNEFRRIDSQTEPNEGVFTNVASYRKINKGKQNPYFLNGADLASDHEPESPYNRIRRARKLQAKFWLPLVGPGKGRMSISFYCCSDECYSPDHLSLMTSVQDMLAKVINGIRSIREMSDTGALNFHGETGRSTLNPGFEGIIGNNPRLRDILDKVTQVAPYDNTVLVLGETGVGKEGLVKAIHRLSARRDGPLVKINCAAIPANLVESELFGHEKGAFTGALARRIGKFEQANGGTLFLDEIGELPYEMQSKLLRAIQEKEIERVGGRTTISTDVRIVTATNRDLIKEIAVGKFRLDLYYRINVFPITIPPLRERKDDIPILAHHFLQSMGNKFRTGSISLSRAALSQLLDYYWPGNIREMENLIERHVLQARSNVIELFEMPVQMPVDEQNGHPESEIKTFAEMDRDHIMKALKKCNGKVSGRGGAAELLNLKPTTLISKMKRLGVTWPL